MYRRYSLLLILTVLILVYVLDIPVLNMKTTITNKYYAIKLKRSLNCSDNAPLWLKNPLLLSLENNIPAAQIAFIDKEKHVFSCQYGYTDSIKGSTLLTADTRFKYASITKLFTSDAILAMVRNNEISLDEKLVDILEVDSSELKDAKVVEITVRDLLAHTAGFDRSKAGDPIFTIKKKAWCPKDIQKLNDLKLDFVPGIERRYSNLGYCLLSSIIIKKTGENFTDYMEKQYQLDVSGIKYAIDGRFFDDEVQYSFSDNDLSNYMNVFSFESIQSSAGMTGTASSLVKHVSEIINKPEPNILMVDDRLECIPDKYQECYALGSFKFKPNQNHNNYYIRNGSLPGFTGTVVMQPNTGVVAYLGNSRIVNNEKGIVKAIEESIFKGLLIEDER